MAVIFLTVSRVRARKRHGLSVPGIGATALRVVVPAALIVLFIYWMNYGGGMPVPVSLTSKITCTRSERTAEPSDHKAA